MQDMKRFFRATRRGLKWRLRALPSRLRDPAAYEFYSDLMIRGFEPHALIDILPAYKLIYVGVPKAASSTVKRALSALAGHDPGSLAGVHRRSQSGLVGPDGLEPSALYELVRDPAALRFAFVRNPYDRLVSCWADKYQGRPMVAGDAFMNVYLAYRREAGLTVKRDRDATLSFADFVEMAIATCNSRIDPHWARMDDILSMPGIDLDFVGKSESFAADFERVIDHTSRDERLLRALPRMNRSVRTGCRDYYDADLARRVFKAYEADFARFGYAQGLPD